jgi:molybdopterin molybdotransferase
MTGFDEAYQLIQSFAKAGQKEIVGLDAVSGRILASVVKTDADMPPFDRSAMDGYACRRQDLNKKLIVVEEIPAGTTPAKEISEGTCSKIMTGAEIPPGAECVVKVEDSIPLSDNRVKFKVSGNVNNIRRRGEDLTKGDLLIEEGTKLGGQHIGLMAMAGCVNPEVYCLPKVGVLSTGSELVNAAENPTSSGIRNSNGPQLVSQLKSLGIEAKDLGIVEDEEQYLRNIIESNLNDLDVLLVSGGVSMGDYDFVPGVISDLGFDIKLHKMKVRPGKPLLFAVRENKFVFGLPGNPVSTLVQFEVIIKPFLLKLMGASRLDDRIKIELGEDLQIKSLPLRFFIPVKIKSGLAYALEYHGSGHLASYSLADGILEIPENTSLIKKKELVYVRPF